jgi:hypothetical protein
VPGSGATHVHRLRGPPRAPAGVPDDLLLVREQKHAGRGDHRRAAVRGARDAVLHERRVEVPRDDPVRGHVPQEVLAHVPRSLEVRGVQRVPVHCAGVSRVECGGGRGGALFAKPYTPQACPRDQVELSA